MRIFGLIFALFMLSGPAQAMPPGMSASCQQAWASYQSAPSPKAFAAGKTKGCGWRNEGNTGTLDDAKQKALATCQRFGDGCRIVEAK